MDSSGPKEACIRRGAHWRRLANAAEPSVCGVDAACCQITLTTCLSSKHVLTVLFLVDDYSRKNVVTPRVTPTCPQSGGHSPGGSNIGVERRAGNTHSPAGTEFWHGDKARLEAFSCHPPSSTTTSGCHIPSTARVNHIGLYSHHSNACSIGEVK